MKFKNFGLACCFSTLVLLSGCSVNGHKVDWLGIAIDVLVADDCPEDCCCRKCKHHH